MNNLQQFTDYVYRFPECESCDATLKILNIRVEFIRKNELEFDIIGLKPFVVNAIRQTILNDIPTMAIEDVYFYKNSSIFNCDYISQRLALVPINAEPNDFKYVYNSDMSQLNSDSAIVMNLNASNSDNKVKTVYSSSLIWEPIGEKQKKLSKIEPLFTSIPLLCLKPSEEVACKVYCIKGIGRNHMKFSPGFASYRFLSKIDISTEKITSQLAHTLQESFPPGVIGLKLKPNSNNELVPFVSNARLDRHSRSFKNNEDIEKNVRVQYYRDYIIF